MANTIEPEVLRAMRRFRLLLDERERRTMVEMAEHWARLERNITAHLEALAEEIAGRLAVGQTVTADMVRLSRRYLDLQNQVRDQVSEYAGWSAGRIGEEQRWMARAGIGHAAEMLRSTLPRGGVAGAFNVLPVEALELMAGYVADGSPLRAYFARMYPAAMQGIMDGMMLGMARGWGPRQLARAMRDGMGVAPRTAINSARTEPLRVYREASLQQYRASGMVDGYIRVAAKSERTCMACLAKDGEWFPLTTPFEEHNQGRCKPAPARKGQTYPGTQGLAWFEEQSPERQRLMLGPGRYEAWKRGEFDLRDIAKLHKDPVWGNAWQERSLKELRGLGGGQQQDQAAARPVLDPTSREARAQAAGYRPAPEVRTELGKLSSTKAKIDDLDAMMGDYQRMVFEQDVKLHQMRFASGQVDRGELVFVENTREQFKSRLQDLQAQRAQLVETFERQASALVDVPENKWLQVGVKSRAALASAWREGVDRFRRLVDGTVYDGMDEIVTFKSNKRRAYYDLTTKAIHVDGRRNTIVHELGHWLEGQSEYIHEQALKFLARRAQGEQARWLGSGYGKSERAWFDKFITPYIGKDYAGKASEVISMGLQYMAQDPVEFARLDPDMFDFIYYLMRGLL